MRLKCEFCGVKSKFSANKARTEVRCPHCQKTMRLHDLLQNKNQRAEAEANERQRRQHAAQIKAAEVALPKNPLPSTPTKPIVKKKKPSLNKTGKNKRAKKTEPKLKQSHKELVAQIAEENRAYFEASKSAMSQEHFTTENSKNSTPQISNNDENKLQLCARKFVEDSIKETFGEAGYKAFGEAGYDPMEMQSCRLLSKRSYEYIWAFDYKSSCEQFSVEARLSHNGSEWVLNLQNPKHDFSKEKCISSQLSTSQPSKTYTPKCPVCQSPNLAKVNPVSGLFKGGITGVSKRHECLSCGHLF